MKFNVGASSPFEVLQNSECDGVEESFGMIYKRSSEGFPALESQEE